MASHDKDRGRGRYYFPTEAGEKGRRLGNREKLWKLLADRKEHTHDECMDAGGSRFGGRLKELRDAGHLIATIEKAKGTHHYKLYWPKDEVTPERYRWFELTYPDSLPKKRDDTLLRERVEALEGEVAEMRERQERQNAIFAAALVALGGQLRVNPKSLSAFRGRKVVSRPEGGLWVYELEEPWNM